MVGSQSGFALAGKGFQAVGVDLGQEILLVAFGVVRFIGLKQVVVDPRFDVDSVFGVDPVEGALHLAACIGAAAALAFRVVRAVQLDDVAGFVLDDVFTLDDIAVFQADFLARSQAEELLNRFFHEVVLFDVDGLAEGNLTGAHGFVFLIVFRRYRFRLAVGIVGNDDLQGIDDRHETRRFEL